MLIIYNKIKTVVVFMTTSVAETTVFINRHFRSKILPINKKNKK